MGYDDFFSIGSDDHLYRWATELEEEQDTGKPLKRHSFNISLLHKVGRVGLTADELTSVAEVLRRTGDYKNILGEQVTPFRISQFSALPSHLLNAGVAIYTDETRQSLMGHQMQVMCLTQFLAPGEFQKFCSLKRNEKFNSRPGSITLSEIDKTRIVVPTNTPGPMDAYSDLPEWLRPMGEQS